jgi:hypothetical protein
MATEFISNSWLMPTNANAEANRVSNYSLDCDGAAQHLTFASAGDSFGNNEAFTFSFWCKVNTMAAYKAFFDFSPPTGFGLLALRTQSTSVIELLKSGASLGTHTFSDTTNFHNFCIVYDKTNIKLYIDNVEVISSAQTNMGDFTGLDLYLANGYFLTSRLDCKLTEVSIFDYALSSSQRTELYGTGSAIGNPMSLATKPVNYYPLGDAAFNGEFLATNNATELYENYALDFDGVNDYILTGSAIDLGTSCSISFWYSGATSGRNGSVVGGRSYAEGGLPSNYQAIFLSAGTYLAFYQSNSATPKTFIYGSSPMNSSDWFHAVIVRDGANLNLYLNGADTSTSYTDLDATAPTYVRNIATNGENQTGTQTLTGKISNVSLFNSALTAAQVTTLYNSGKPFDLNTFAVTPTNWWRLGASGSSFDSTNWTVLDEVGTSNGTSANMTQADLVDGVGATGNGVSSGMSSGTNKTGDAPYSSSNAVSYNMSVLAKSTSVPT